MIDLSWLAAVPATAHTLWLRTKMRGMIRAEIGGATGDALRDARRALADQAAHGLQLWPRPWLGGRPMTQVEELMEWGKTWLGLVESGKIWLGGPLDPDEQRAQMLAGAQSILDSYQPGGADNETEDRG